MKKLLSYTLLMILAIVALNSCRKDESSMDLNKINGVVIDTTGQSVLSVFRFETLTMNPVLKMEGVDESNLQYEWKLNIAPNKIDYTTIGTERNLRYELNQSPSSASEHYQLLYVITNKTNGIQYSMAWPLNIRNSIGEGLVVATTEDGINSDISHIMSPLVTPEYTQDKVLRNLYSNVNDKTIPGVLKQLRFTKVRNIGAVMMGISTNTIASIKTLNYELAGMNEDLFYSPVVDGATRTNQLLGGITQKDIYIGNGKLSAVWLEISDKMALPFDTKFTVPSIVAINANQSPFDAQTISFYDEVTGAFIYQPSVTYGDKNQYRLPSNPNAQFNPTLPNQKNLAAAVTSEGDFLHLLKDKSNNKVGIYTIKQGYYDADWNEVPLAADAYYDLSAAPEINNAEYFVFLVDQKVLYYATKTKIYAVVYSTTTPVFSERYTVPAGEEITTLQVYQQADYPKRYEGWDPPYIPTNNKQLIMSTYKGTEGKVYILPMINFGVGNIDIPNIKVFDGFKKVTAIGVQGG